MSFPEGMMNVWCERVRRCWRRSQIHCVPSNLGCVSSFIVPNRAKARSDEPRPQQILRKIHKFYANYAKCTQITQILRKLHKFYANYANLRKFFFAFVHPNIHCQQPLGMHLYRYCSNNRGNEVKNCNIEEKEKRVYIGSCQDRASSRNILSLPLLYLCVFIYHESLSHVMQISILCNVYMYILSAWFGKYIRAVLDKDRSWTQ